ATRGRGIGQRLIEYQLHVLRLECRVVLGEVRTAEPGGWRIVRRGGFVPVGFEPFAHFMPVGHEPMLVAARLPAGALHADRSGLVTTAAVRRLAETVVPRPGGTSRVT